jgi:gliding motility-associated-like protein
VKHLISIFTFLLFSFQVNSQTQGNAYSFKGINTYVKMGEMLKAIETIEFWIKPAANINGSGAVQPILVRDIDGMQFIGVEEFALFFEGSQGAQPGKLAFRVGDGTQNATIYSDRNSWNADQWYHIAVIVDNFSGLSMYVNGVEQTDLNSNVMSVYFRSEGPTGDLLLGRWDNIETDYLNAQIEEMRFWDISRSEHSIRANMCQKIITGPKYYIPFDTKSTGALSVLGSTANPSIINGNISHYKTSSAPVGLSSVHLYTNDFSGKALLMQRLYSIKIDSIQATAEGLHIYDFMINAQPGIYNRGQFGVWFTDVNAKYSATFNHGLLANECDSCISLKSREDATKGSWIKRNGIIEGCNSTLYNESILGKGHKEEYMFLDTVIIETGLGDTVTFCSTDSKFLNSNHYPNAVYVWNDTSYTQNLLVEKPGMHRLTVFWEGCHVSKDVWVEFKPTPEFYLPADTTICEGDTLWLTAPIDSAQYLWVGFFNQRTFGITAPGTYNLKITLGDCSFVDEIKVDVMKNFSMSLGPDTNLCLGQSITYAFNGEGINYLWNDGKTSSYRTILNAPGRYWLKAYNDCFEKYDTVDISYEECECRIFVSNSFTPNDDESNDMFMPVSGCYYEEFEFEILNRWGAIIFVSNSLDQGWDGNINGKKAPIGMYNWRMRYKKFSWQKLSNYDYGQVHLIR